MSDSRIRTENSRKKTEVKSADFMNCIKDLEFIIVIQIAGNLPTFNKEILLSIKCVICIISFWF